MSSYLHTFPIVDGALLEELEAVAAEHELSLKNVQRGKTPTREDFDEAISTVESYDYSFDDESGSMDLRSSAPEELYAIISRIAKKCGPQLVMTDDTDVFIFQPDTPKSEFSESIIFCE